MKQSIFKRAACAVLTMTLTLGAASNFALSKSYADGTKVQKKITLSNGGFENKEDNKKYWILNGFNEIKKDGTNNTTNLLNLWLSDESDTAASATYKMKLNAGEYYFSFELSGENMTSGLKYKIMSGEKTLTEGRKTYETTGWDVWAEHKTNSFKLSKTSIVTFTLEGTVPAGYWGYLDNLKCFKGTNVDEEADPEQPDPVSSSIYVPYVAGSDSDDFIRGADISSVLSILKSKEQNGTYFKDWEGNDITGTIDEQGEKLFKLMADAGMNWARIRVWNDPFDKDGKGYGGGNNDIEAAKIMGKWATKAGMKVLIDFHYSDFWADPSRQLVPKAWAGYTAEQKATAVKEFTTNSLNTLIDADVDVGMVQIGNETNNAICGEGTSTEGGINIFKAGAAAVRAVSADKKKDIQIAVHFTDPQTEDNYANIAKMLKEKEVDYDVFASSWYPDSHGTLDNLTKVLKDVADTYNKKVMVAETSWGWTLEDGDGNGNTLNSDDHEYYPFSVQGQALEVAKVMQAVKNMGDAGLGFFYWEAAWIPVSNTSGLTGDAYTAQVNKNKELWEKYGSGWASSYAKVYDPDNVGEWYGGSVIDNQAFFDFDGKPLESLKVYNYVWTGTKDYTNSIFNIEVEDSIICAFGGEYTLPEAAKVIYVNDETETAEITWDQDDIAKVNTNNTGEYTVNGTFTNPVTKQQESTSVTITVENPNLLKNPSFEEEDMSAYTISSIAGRKGENPYSGTYALHFWSDSNFNFTAEQKVTLDAGKYQFKLYAQGGDAGENAEFYSYVKIDGQEYKTADFELTGWKVWTAPEITFTLKEQSDVIVGVYAKAAAGGWGTFDDWSLRELEKIVDSETSPH